MFRYLSLRFPALLLGLMFCNLASAQIDFDFPKEGVPVLRIDEYYTEAKKDKRPMLLVFSDGRVLRSVSENEADDYEFTLSEQKFAQVLKQIFVVNDFATISDEKILDEISTKRKKRPSRNTFRVTSNTAKGSHVVDFGTTWVYDRLGLGRKRYPNATELKRFLRVEDACREIADLALIGGEEAFQFIVKEARANFSKAYPDGPKITDTHLYRVRRNSDGDVSIRFLVAKKVVEPHPVSVWVTKVKGNDDLTIEVKIDAPRGLH